MNFSKCGSPLTTLVCTAICIILFAPESGAQRRGPLSAAVSFSAPVQLPGVVLPAGTYVFEHIFNVSNADSVEVSTRQPKRVIARFHTVATIRTSAGEAVTFRKTRSDMPPAISAWYVDGGRAGYEFLYTVDELRALALAPAAPTVALVP